MILLFLYGGLAFVFMKELDRVNNHYLRIVGVGLISMIIMQMFVNIGVNTKILPLTGLTLPFVSA
jgi:cell division protein FtsW (lipid II flippase)